MAPRRALKCAIVVLVACSMSVHSLETCALNLTQHGLGPPVIIGGVGDSGSGSSMLQHITWHAENHSQRQHLS